MRFTTTRNGRQPPVGHGSDITGFADAVGVLVVPKRYPLQLGALQGAIVIVVQGTQRGIAVVPEDPKVTLPNICRAEVIWP